MGDYTVQHNYRSTRDGQEFGPWVGGDVVQLDRADAEWVNRDSPGCLAEDGPEPAKRQARPAADRQHRGGRNRSA